MGEGSYDTYMEEREYWLGFSVFPGIGPKRFQNLITAFTTAENAWNASESELKNVLGEVLTDKFIAFRNTFSYDEYEEKLAKNQVTFLTSFDSSYPSPLSSLSNPPFVLYVKGESDVNSFMQQNVIAVVGTRRITSYGRQVTEMITRDLVGSGCVIVSGLAMGVDTVAHQVTLNNGGKTIAVLGCGVDCCHPTVNQRLYQDIISSGGTILSEFPLQQAPSKGSFPSRNRIIAGLSQAIVVTEGTEDSGALITAKDAFTCQRKVFAVPGPVTSRLSRGPNSLLSKGAILATSAEDIMEEMGIKARKEEKQHKTKVFGETEEEQKIIDILENERLLFDEIVRRTDLISSTVGTLLSLMEIKGIVKQDSTHTYFLAE